MKTENIKEILKKAATKKETDQKIKDRASACMAEVTLVLAKYRCTIIVTQQTYYGQPVFIPFINPET